jgi:hypothetical protein
VSVARQLGLTVALLAVGCALSAAATATGTHRASAACSASPEQVAAPWRKQAAQAVKVGPVVAPAYSLGPIVSARCAAFPLRLTLDSRLTVDGSCFIYVVQFKDSYIVRSGVGKTRLRLPAGRWTVEAKYVEQGRGGASTYALGDGTAPVIKRQPGWVTVPANKNPGGRGPLIHNGAKYRPLGRLACGISVARYLPFPLRKPPSFYAYATARWPSLNALGTNVPVDPGKPGGGLNDDAPSKPSDWFGVVRDWQPDHEIDQPHTCKAVRQAFANYSHFPDAQDALAAIWAYKLRAC